MALPLGWLAYDERDAARAAARSRTTRACSATRRSAKALWNTVVLAFWSGVASLAIGAPLAWLTARTDLPGHAADPRASCWRRS